MKNKITSLASALWAISVLAGAAAPAHANLLTNGSFENPAGGSDSYCYMSSSCTIEIQELEGPKVEVKFIGKGQPVHKAIKEIRKGEWFVYTGDDDKHECSWFVIITELDEK